MSPGSSSSFALSTRAFPSSVTRTRAYIHTHTRANTCLHLCCCHQTAPPAAPAGRQAGRFPAQPWQRAAPACTAPQLRSCPTSLPLEAFSSWDMHSSSSSQGQRISMLILEKAHSCCVQCRKSCLWQEGKGWGQYSCPFLVQFLD